ncbi:MAG: DUF1318 domain-containing protein [Bdellovibrionales bacterium]|nr:DUF1318 domain-containing protein [Bdellovibrionales bacterium]NQZ20407.1 DUF1318 domain-containing protein [Bdellovibrionales bacterium]
MFKQLGILFVTTLLFLGCASQEQRWPGSIQEYTSQYVDELRHLSKEESQRINLFEKLIIEKAYAKKKRKRKTASETKAKKKKKGLVNPKPLVLKTSKVKKIQKRQARRMTRVDYYKVNKNIGEKENGLIAVRSKKGLSKKQLKELIELVEAENKDRNLLYAMIVKNSGYDKKREAILRNSFFESYQEWAPVGTYYYKNNKWQKK